MARIVSVRSKGKKTVLVTLEIEENGVSKKYTVSEGTYREIGCPLSGENTDEAALLRISSEDEAHRAMAKALRVLAYADNNERTLMRKLISAGFGKEASADAVRECVRLGYINEQRQAERIIVRCAAELYGPRRILKKLTDRGYSPALGGRIITELENSGELDFKKMKQELLSKKLSPDATYDERRRLLHRYGYIK